MQLFAIKLIDCILLNEGNIYEHGNMGVRKRNKLGTNGFSI